MDATKERELEGARIDQAKAVEVAVSGGATVEELEKPKPFPGSRDWPMSGDDLALVRAGRVRNWKPLRQAYPEWNAGAEKYEQPSGTYYPRTTNDKSVKIMPLVDNAARPDDATDDAAHEQPGMLDVDVSNSTVLIDTNPWTGTITVMLNDATIYKGDPENDENAVEILRQATEAYRNGDHAKLNSLLR